MIGAPLPPINEFHTKVSRRGDVDVFNDDGGEQEVAYAGVSEQ